MHDNKLLMTRRAVLRAAGAAVAASALAPKSACGAEGRRPNILWITCEDISPHLGCYGVEQARTPNLDRLASQGARFANAFTITGCCAPSRSCLITGMYPASIGTHHMRCTAAIHPPVRCFTEWLREAGYYCSNNVKTDYNFPTPKTAWDDCNDTAHWRGRAAGKPFFSVFNLTITHEHRVQALPKESATSPQGAPAEERHDPAKAVPPPYYPDTPLVHAIWANYFDLVTRMDAQAGAILKQLEDDGLADGTIVFFFSDHGVGLPRAKRWVYDSSLHVPLLICWPGQIKPGTVIEELVSFVDMAPTVLSLAGVPIPAHMQGQAFLGPQKVGQPRQWIHGARDRMDQRYDIIRAVRDKRHKYIRNFEPYRPYAQYVTYSETRPVMKEMRQLYEAGRLSGPPALFFRPTKPVEELYDIQNDPHEVNNRADSPPYRETLLRMRTEVERWMIGINDLGLVPEPLLRETAGASQPSDKPAAETSLPLLGRSIEELKARLNDPRRIVRLLAMKALVENGSKVVAELVLTLKHDDPAMRYWAAVHLGVVGPPAEPAIADLEGALRDPSLIVRIAAAYSLSQLNRRGAALPVLCEALTGPDASVHLYAADALDCLGDHGAEATAALEAAMKEKNSWEVRSIVQHALGLTDESAKQSK